MQPFNNAFLLPPIQPNASAAPGMPTMPQLRNTLNLNQVEGFEPVQQFRDESNTDWRLVKAASNSTVDIPDPKAMQIVDYWVHDFPGLQTKLYVYVVEGVKQPRVETEQPMRVLYQWFSSVPVYSFTPAMITEKEWLKANVYSAPVVNARMSKLRAICRLSEDAGQGQDRDEDKLLQVEELNHGTASQGNQRANRKGNERP